MFAVSIPEIQLKGEDQKKITPPSALISMSYGFNTSKQLTPVEEHYVEKVTLF